MSVGTACNCPHIAVDRSGRVYLTEGFVSSLNARFDTIEKLIVMQSAAPELLLACKTLLAECEQTASTMQVENARAAIARAEGR